MVVVRSVRYGLTKNGPGCLIALRHETAEPATPFDILLILPDAPDFPEGGLGRLGGGSSGLDAPEGLVGCRVA